MLEFFIEEIPGCQGGDISVSVFLTLTPIPRIRLLGNLKAVVSFRQFLTKFQQLVLGNLGVGTKPVDLFDEISNLLLNIPYRRFILYHSGAPKVCQTLGRP